MSPKTEMVGEADFSDFRVGIAATDVAAAYPPTAAAKPTPGNEVVVKDSSERSFANCIDFAAYTILQQYPGGRTIHLKDFMELATGLTYLKGVPYDQFLEDLRNNPNVTKVSRGTLYVGDHQPNTLRSSRAAHQFAANIGKTATKTQRSLDALLVQWWQTAPKARHKSPSRKGLHYKRINEA
ncbi:MAG: hypothetical protein ACYCPS_03340 [Candidatus Saccharimonadales bacterium]